MPSDIFAGIPRGHFRTIVMDPPWFFSAGTKKRPQHYPRMRDGEIADLPIADLAHPDGCNLLMWVTSPKAYPPPGSKSAMTPAQIARRMGFRYSSRAFVWVKTERSETDPLFIYSDSLHTGMGFTTRKNAEDVLIFKRGKPRRMSNAVHEIIFAPVRQHSRKPDEFYKRAEQLCEGPYLELFARESRPNWTTWGNEKDKFDLPARFSEAA